MRCPHHLIVIWSLEILIIGWHSLSPNHLRRHLIPGLIANNTLLSKHWVLVHIHRLSHDHSLVGTGTIGRHHLLWATWHLTSNLLARTWNLSHTHLRNSCNSRLTNESSILLNEILSVHLLSRIRMSLHGDHLLLLLLLEDYLIRMLLIRLDDHILWWHSLLLLLVQAQSMDRWLNALLKNYVWWFLRWLILSLLHLLLILLLLL